MDLKKLKKAMAAAGLTTSAVSLFATEPAFAKCKTSCTTCQTCSSCTQTQSNKTPVCSSSIACGQQKLAGVDLEPSTGGTLV